ncbi:DoxX family protein [Streptomyces sp. NPDC056568]|uniref:DoxX family protein n=1 Tax=Streptomyces sp. NPDC056568 TaxID=3345866 RepID=UPI0036B370D0
MNVFLWIVQAVLALMFAMAGVMKSTQPKAKLAEKLPWVSDYSAGTVRFIGAVELAAALGLILPATTGIAPVLTPLAATGLAVVMVLAMITHARRKEPSAIGFNAVLLILAALVAWGRFGPYSF